MANNNNIEGVVSTTNTQIVANGYKLPSDFNNSRQPEELLSLFNANSNTIYKKFNIKTGYTNALFKFGPRQPFVTANPNNYNKLISTRAIPLGSAIDDLERITKWQLTGDGVIFTATQLFLQGQNAFNETKIYNPLMPIQTVASKLSMGILPTPKRFIDLSGGFTSALGFGSSDVPVDTTVASGDTGVSALSDRVKASSNPFKGLLRGATASDAANKMNQKWSEKPSEGLLASYFKNGFNKLIGGILPVSQPPNTYYRADEGMYGIMIGAKDKFKSSLATSNNDDYSWGSELYQRWEAGSNTNGANESIKKENQTSIDDNKKLLKVFNKTIPQTAQYFGNAIGYTPNNNNYGYKTYGDNVGVTPIKLKNLGETSYEYSDILSIYKSYTSIEGTVEKNTKVASEAKFNDPNSDSVKSINDTLQKVINKLKSAGYTYAPDDAADKMMQQFSSNKYIGLDNITYKTKDPFSDTKGISPKDYNGGYMTNFRTAAKRKNLLDDEEKGKGFPTTNKPDKVNTVGVLKADEFGDNKQYDKNKDDLIAFYFYDVVNDKYIPFRAVFRGVSESLTAEWNDVNYLGRADKLFTYKGFTRSISFNFTVNITSIKEFFPTWQKINYFVSLVKPSNYTAKDNDNLKLYSRFIIPPLVKFTMGDLYVDQPATITSIGFSVPDDASWETLNENYSNTYDWSYLNDTIKLKGSKGKYAQLPRTVDFSVSMNLLEREKPIVGGSHFGSTYRTDPYYKNLNTKSDSFSSNLLVK